MRVGTAVALRSEVEPHLVTNGISWEDLLLHEPDFKALYGYTQNQWLRGESGNDRHRFIPWFVISERSGKVRVIQANSGKTRVVKTTDVWVGSAEPFVPKARFQWIPLSCYQSGEPTASPRPPLESGRPSVIFSNHRWIGVEHSDADHLRIFSPRNRFPDLEVVDFVVGLPWIHPYQSRISHSKTGAGFVVKLPSDSVRYYRSAANSNVADYPTYSEQGSDYFYIPVNRVELSFVSNRPADSASWFSINWCFTGFRHLFSPSLTA